MFEGFKQFKSKTSGAEIFGRIKGSGEPLLLVHGYPQTHVMWHKIANSLAEDFTVVCVDLRGYGDSSKPLSSDSHITYSKRAMAQDLVEVMDNLSFQRFNMVGHDRGGRVGHRLALDHGDRINSLTIIDIVPTIDVFDSCNQDIATEQYHWFFLAQENNLPEHLIGLDPKFYLESRIFQSGSDPSAFPQYVLDEYTRCFSDPQSIHASCEDYRAAATIDLIHDREDYSSVCELPVMLIWSETGFNDRYFDVRATWRRQFSNIHSATLESGHFIPEEKPQETEVIIRSFLSKVPSCR